MWRFYFSGFLDVWCIFESGVVLLLRGRLHRQLVSDWLAVWLKDTTTTTTTNQNISRKTFFVFQTCGEDVKLKLLIASLVRSAASSRWPWAPACAAASRRRCALRSTAPRRASPSPWPCRRTPAPPPSWSRQSARTSTAAWPSRSDRETARLTGTSHKFRVIETIWCFPWKL